MTQFLLKDECYDLFQLYKPKFTNGKWENVKIEFIDPISPSTSQSLYKIVEFLIDSNKADKNFKIKLKALDPTGTTVEEWVINVKNVLTIDFDEYDYNNDNLQKPFIVIEPISCILKPQQF